MNRRAVAGWLLSTAVIAAVIHTLADDFPKTLVGVLTWGAGLLLIPDISIQTRRQILILVGIGLTGIAWGMVHQISPDWRMILSGNALLLSMLAAVSFLRLITRPDTEEGETLPSGRRAVWSTLFGVHLFGSVINLSSVFIMGDRISRLGRLNQAQTIVLTRGFTAAAFWSPFFAAMAAALTYAPGASLPQIWLMGIPLAASALLFTALGCQGNDQFTGYPMHPSALILPGILALFVLLLHQWHSDWHILGIIALLAPTLSLAVTSIRHPRPHIRTVEHITKDLPGMQNELTLFLAAGVMAAGLNAVFAAAGGWLPFDQFTGIEASLVLLFMVSTSILGVHPVINIAALGTLLAPLNPDGSLLAMTFISAWAIGTGTSPFSGINLAMQGRYNQQGADSLRWNGLYAAVMVVLSILVLNLFAVFGLQ
ncbi:MAG: hypothetical protein ABW170_20370 [Candidatus Thiodiazotropha sp. L084R]